MTEAATRRGRRMAARYTTGTVIASWPPESIRQPASVCWRVGWYLRRFRRRRTTTTTSIPTVVVWSWCVRRTTQVATSCGCSAGSTKSDARRGDEPVQSADPWEPWQANATGYRSIVMRITAHQVLGDVLRDRFQWPDADASSAGRWRSTRTKWKATRSAGSAGA
jgi:hypothetical protein